MFGQIEVIDGRSGQVRSGRSGAGQKFVLGNFGIKKKLNINKETIPGPI